MRMPSTMLLFAAVWATTGAAMNVAAANEDDSYIAVVTGNNVYVRSGAADSYYPFGRVNTGDLVKVTGEKFNWGRVATTGPTFTAERFFGYIIYPTTQPGRFRLSPDGKSGITLGRADVLAPNLNTNNNPNDSWKPLIRLEAGTDVTVLETTTTSNNTVHKIVLPENAEAWISVAYLRRATDAERREWEAKTRPAAKPAETKPEPAPAETPQIDEAPSQPQAEPVKPEAQPATRPATQPEVTPAVSPAAEPEPQEAPQDPLQAEASQPAEPHEVDIPAEQTVMPALGNVQPEPVTPSNEEAAEQSTPPLAERLAEVTLEDLEQAYEQLRKESIENAEVGPLREMYLSFAARVEESDRTGATFARSRADQLKLLADVQQRRNELDQIRARARISAERAEAALLAVDAGGDYIAVGRLASSTIYDGSRLPKMLRLQDPGTGRTVAYIEPDDGYDMAGMLDQLIGVIGERTYDGGLRLNVLKPRRIDILAPR